MVITYKMPALSWRMMKRLQLQPFVGLPNILAGKFVVPELLQDEATPNNLASAAVKLLSDTEYLAEIQAELTKIHYDLRQNTAEKAANAVISQLNLA